VRPLYRLPLFQRRVAIGAHGYPFNLTSVRYDQVSCSVTERMHETELLTFEPCAYDLDAASVDLLVSAIRKVHAQRRALAAHVAARSANDNHAAHLAKGQVV